MTSYLLLDPWTDFDKTFWVHRVDPKLVYRQHFSQLFRKRSSGLRSKQEIVDDALVLGQLYAPQKAHQIGPRVQEEIARHT